MKIWRTIFAAAFVAMASSASADMADVDPAKIEGPTKCAECHKATSALWQKTHHFTTFRSMPRSKEAREIAKKMGIRRIKSESLCLNCHFTSQVKDGKPAPVAGISCESCHGAAKGWLKRHSEYSGKKKETEAKAEAAKRWKDSEAAGMIRPRQTYKLAKNCYSCHITPNEKLINVGGHSAGSEFELVSWSQGEVRHNVWYNENKGNPFASAERKRMLFVVGAIVELEESLSAVGKATQKASYAVSMAKRALRAKKRMEQIAGAVNVPELKQIFAIAKPARLKLNNNAELTGAAKKIAALGAKFAAKYDGSKLAGVDSLIPGESAYKGSAK